MFLCVSDEVIRKWIWRLSFWLTSALTSSVFNIASIITRSFFWEERFKIHFNSCKIWSTQSNNDLISQSVTTCCFATLTDLLHSRKQINPNTIFYLGKNPKTSQINKQWILNYDRISSIHWISACEVTFQCMLLSVWEWYKIEMLLTWKYNQPY